MLCLNNLQCIHHYGASTISTISTISTNTAVFHNGQLTRLCNTTKKAIKGVCEAVFVQSACHQYAESDPVVEHSNIQM